MNVGRIADISARFNGGVSLERGNRLLVQEGTVQKVCRKGLQARQLFLFCDIIVYGTPVGKDKYKSQAILELRGCAIANVEDSADGANGFTIQSGKKSFVAYASTRTEKAEWVANITRFIELSRTAAGVTEPVATRAVWVSDKKVKQCMMNCGANFTLVNRRHHCRNCGKCVCGKCSNVKAILNQQKPERVCTMCHRKLGGLAPSDVPDSKGVASTETVKSKAADDDSDSDSDSSSDDEGEPTAVIAGSSAAAVAGARDSVTVEAPDLTNSERSMHAMSDSDRMELMEMVKSGTMTMDEAMAKIDKKKSATATAGGSNPFEAPKADAAKLTVPHCVAQYANDDPEGDDELTFAEDDVIILTGKVNDEWLAGYVQGADPSTKGIFPAAFVEIVIPVPE